MACETHIAYFDESGDHGLDNIDLEFPVFVLCGCVFKISDYLHHDAPNFSAIKFKHFTHDAVIFHSREIRKRVGHFQILSQAAKRQEFMDDISNFFRQSRVTLIASGINKLAHKQQYKFPGDPYEISLLFCLERLYGHLVDLGLKGEPITCVFEKRGEREDAILANQFERICAGENRWGRLPFRMVFASKQTNMCGLQMADLAAYPIARKILFPDAVNASYEAIEPRFRRSPGGKIHGWGLKVFP